MKKFTLIFLLSINYVLAQTPSKIREQGFENLAIGKNAMMLSDTLVAVENLAFGEKSLQFLSTGKYNTAIGPWNLKVLTSGEYNTALGNYSLTRLSIGSRNLGVGPNTLNHIVDGSDNVAVGRLAGYNLGDFGNSMNIMIGTNSGFNGGFIGTNWYGSNNVILGGWSPAQSSSMNNTMVFATGNGVERYRVTNTGNFIVGSTIDNGQNKMQINGSLSSNGVTIFKNGSQAQLTGKRIDGSQLGYLTFSEKPNGFGQGQIGAGLTNGNTNGVFYWDGETRHVKFFGTAEGVNPVNGEDLTTKNYVDNLLNSSISINKAKFFATSPWENTYYIEHGWNGQGWNLTANNNAGDEQANIHKVNINGNAASTTSMLWKHYGGGHIIFDASNSTSPSNSSISNVDAQVAWSPTYPTLMGWNGANTFGIRVDRARVADSSNETFQTIIDKGNSTTSSITVALNQNETLRVGHNTQLNAAWFGTGTFGKSGTDKALLGYVSSNTNGAVVGAHNSELNAWAKLNMSGSELGFRIGETQQMVLLSNGNFGIGSNSPDEKLTVNGSIKSKEVKVQPNGWPDYVFEPTYKLLTLIETEKYINENKHLPEIPSEKEINDKGLSLGEMNTLLLKKIEELTLHLIQQSKNQELIIKELSTVKKELKTLKAEIK